MFVYLLLFFLIIILIFLLATTINYTVVKLLYVLILCYIFFLVGFRDTIIGNDTSVYVQVFRNVPKYIIDWSEFFTSRFELGFLLYNKLLYSINNQPLFMLIGYALPTVLINGYVIYKKSANIGLSLLVFCSFGYLGFSLSGIRPMLAISLLVLGYYFYEERKIFRALIALFLACSFHLTSLLFVVLLPFKNMKLTRHKIIVFSVMAFSLFLVIGNIFITALGYFSKYAKYELAIQETPKLGSFLNFMVLLLVFIFGELVKDDLKTKYEQSLRRMVFFAVLTSFISLRIPLFGRFSLQLGYFIVLYLPTVITKIKSKQLKIICAVIVTVSFCLYFFSILILKPEWNNIVPYRTYLF